MTLQQSPLSSHNSKADFMSRKARAQVAVLAGVVLTTLLPGCSSDDATPTATTPSTSTSQKPTSAASPDEAATALTQSEQLTKLLGSGPVKTAAIQSHAWNGTTVQVSVKADAATERMKLCAYLLEELHNNTQVEQILIPAVSASGKQPLPLVRWNFPDKSCIQDPA